MPSHRKTPTKPTSHGCPSALSAPGRLNSLNILATLVKDFTVQRTGASPLHVVTNSASAGTQFPLPSNAFTNPSSGLAGGILLCLSRGPKGCLRAARIKGVGQSWSLLVVDTLQESKATSGVVAAGGFTTHLKGKWEAAVPDGMQPNLQPADNCGVCADC